MKISYNWLKEIYPTSLSPTEVAELLTAGGLEVESLEEYESVKGGLKGLIVGEVRTCVKHPDADKLSLTTVDTGNGELHQIVCGAPNVAAGQKVVVALPGAKLYPTGGEPFIIKQAKIRGQISNGMICAEDEIGLGISHAGIIILPAETKIGIPAAEVFQVKSDTILEIGLTPNRADAASHIGVARDLAAIISTGKLIDEGKEVKQNLHIPALKELQQNGNGQISVVVENTEACPRYSGISISGVLVKESPSWLKDRLLSIGIHPINNIVDITNYVLHECGQPLHAFDADEIKGKKVVVRPARENEKFVTLDKIERNLSKEDLMICNESEAMCIAGVFGGLHSGITSNTKNVFLESACFNPSWIRRTGKRHSLKTDASFRFERGTDPLLTVYALRRAADLMCEIAGGQITSGIIDIYPNPVAPAIIQLKYDYLDRFSGQIIDRKIIKSILSSLGIGVSKETEMGLTAEVPPFKVDVTRPADLAEEILRIYGYNRIPLPEKISLSMPAVSEFDIENLIENISSYLSSSGFHEMTTNSMTKKEYTTLPGWSDAHAVHILNPLSQELSVMRQDMLATSLEAVSYNQNRKQHDLQLFEFGKIYHRYNGSYSESYQLCLLLTGNRHAESWKNKTQPVDFYLLKGYVENVLALCGIEDFDSVVSANSAYSSALSFVKNKETLCEFGSIDKQTLKKFDLAQEVYYAQISRDVLVKYAKKKPVRYIEISKFPAVKRDLSMLVNKEVSFDQLEKIAYAAERKLLTGIRLFDVYEGEKIQAGKKSCALSFILQDDQQTLTDQQINKVMDKLMSAYEKEAGAIIRKS